MANISKLVRRKLGEILVDENLVSEEQIQEALVEQKKTGELLGETLIRMGYVTETDIARAICKQFGLPYLDASRYAIGKEAAALMAPTALYQNRMVVLDKIGKSLIVATAGVVNAEIFQELEGLTGSPPVIYVSTFSQIATALKKLYPQEKFGNGAAP